MSRAPPTLGPQKVHGWASEFCAGRRLSGTSLVWWNERTSPRMVGSRTVGGGGGRRGRRDGGGGGGVATRKSGDRPGSGRGNGSRRFRALVPSRPTPFALALADLLAQARVDRGPDLIPTIGTGDRAQGDQGIDLVGCPMHSRALQSGFDHQ